MYISPKHYWHFKAKNGRIVSDAEAFPTKSNATRAAKACVNAITYPFYNQAIEWMATQSKDGKRTILRWA